MSGANTPESEEERERARARESARQTENVENVVEKERGGERDTRYALYKNTKTKSDSTQYTTPFGSTLTPAPKENCMQTQALRQQDIKRKKAKRAERRQTKR